MNLFPTRLPRIPSLVALDLVPVENRSRARYVLDDSGGRWVCKGEQEAKAGSLLAEALATLLGRYLGAPLPEGAVYVGPDGPAWLVRHVEAAQHWSPSLRDRLRQPAEAGAMLTLDALILNGARRARDLLVVPSPDETRLALHAIDAGDALLSDPAAFSALPPDALPEGEPLRGLPLAALAEGALSAARIAERIDPVLLHEFVSESCALVRSSAVAPLTAALHARCQRASSLAERYLEALARAEAAHGADEPPDEAPLQGALSFRLVQFVPDPFTGGRVPLAALLTDGARSRLVRGPLPGLDALGGRQKAALCRMALEALAELEQAPGPQVVLEEARSLPASDLASAERWLTEHLLCPPPPSEGEPGIVRGPHRATFGRRFFETWKVGDLVRATFRPASDWDGRLARLAPYGEVSHWVAGSDSVLLMEPVVARPQFTEDLRELAKLFAAYRYALPPQEQHAIRLIAYLLPGRTEEQRAEAMAALGEAHQVVDTEDEEQRRKFLEEIREHARTVQQQALLTPPR